MKRETRETQNAYLTRTRAASVLGQIEGTIPSTWEAQKAQSQKLINSDDIYLQELGGI